MPKGAMKKAMKKAVKRDGTPAIEQNPAADAVELQEAWIKAHPEQDASVL